MILEHSESFAIEPAWGRENLGPLVDEDLHKLDDELYRHGDTIIWVEGSRRDIPIVILLAVVPADITEQEERTSLDLMVEAWAEARWPEKLTCPVHALVAFSHLTGGGTLTYSDPWHGDQMRRALERAMGARFYPASSKHHGSSTVVLATTRGPVRIDLSKLNGFIVSGYQGPSR